MTWTFSKTWMGEQGSETIWTPSQLSKIPLAVFDQKISLLQNAFKARMQGGRLAESAADSFKTPILFILLTYGSNISQNISWEMSLLHVLGAVTSVLQYNILRLWIHNHQSPVLHVFIRMQRLGGSKQPLEPAIWSSHFQQQQTSKRKNKIKLN